MFTLILALTYICFISLGLPDSLLGSAWPVMQVQMSVPVSYAGIVSMIICLNTIISSLMSNFLIHKLGIGRIIAISVATTAVALFGFSVSDQYWMLLLWSIPYGLGAGSVDSVLNNYAALHFKSQHMSWLHCMWGVGASIGPSIMGWILSGGSLNWPMGYRVVGLIQLALTAIILISLPLWQNRAVQSPAGEKVRPMPIAELIRLPGAKEIMVTFFCYCALESTAGLWASSFLVYHHRLDAETAAACASLFYIGITAGRALNGFIADRFTDTALTRIGFVIMGLGVIVLLIPAGEIAAMAGLVILGVGCAPTYPCIIHATPIRFGREKSQAFIGVQMASAYLGTTLMPPLFGLIADGIGAWTMPLYLLAILALMAAMHERMLRKVAE